jgi:hypothetical protein
VGKLVIGLTRVVCTLVVSAYWLIALFILAMEQSLTTSTNVAFDGSLSRVTEWFIRTVSISRMLGRNE